MRTDPSVQQGVGGNFRRAGFTIMELMAVIAIIVIVVGLLSVALNQTRNRTMRVMCLDNMRQLQVAWTLYADDNKDFIALNKTAPMGSVGTGVAAAPRNSTNSWVAGNPKEDRNIQTLANGTLYDYVRQPEVYRCPMDSSTTRYGTPRIRSYSMSSYLGGDDEDMDPRVKMRVSDIVNPGPERVFVFIEEHEDSVWTSGFVVLPRENTSLYSTPSDRHLQGCNLTFADGHLEYWEWAAPKKPSSKPPLATNGRELRDLRRLQEAVPKP